MLEVLTAFTLSGLGRLQGSGSVWFLPDWARDVLKYVGTGIILTLFFTWVWVDTTGWTWQWAFLVLIGALSNLFGEGRGLGWLHGYLVRGFEKGSPDGWMKYIPTHKIKKEWLKLLATMLVRGGFWGITIIALTFIDPAYWIYVWAYPIAYAMACVWGWCLQEGFNDLNAWTWIEYLRHPLAFALMIQ